MVWEGQVLNSYLFHSNEYVYVTGYDDEKALFIPDINVDQAEIGYVMDGRARICVTYGTMMYLSKNHNQPNFMAFDSKMGD